jgi:hypothetical protein
VSVANGLMGYAFILNGKAFKFWWNPFIKFSPQSFLYFVRHYRLSATFCHGSLYYVWTPWAQLKGLQSPDITYQLILELHTTSYKLSNWGFRITLAWILGHVGMYGNYMADAVARDATTQGVLSPGILSLDLKAVLFRCILAKCQQDWDHMQVNNIQDVKPVTLPWRSSCCSICHDEVVITRLRMHHTNLTHDQPNPCVCLL